MSNKVISISGYSGNGNQFLVKSSQISLGVSDSFSDEQDKIPSPAEYLLAGFAGSINAVGKLVAIELGVELKSLEVQVSGELETKRAEGLKTRSRAGFRKIEVVIKPTSDAPIDVLKQWMDEVKERCPLLDNLINETPVSLTLLKEFIAA